MGRLSDSFSIVVSHAARVGYLVISRILFCVVGGIALNGLLLYSQYPGLQSAWQSGNWASLFVSGMLLPFLVLTLIAYLVLGYRQGLATALEYIWNILSGPLLDAVAARAAALVTRTSEPIAPQFKKIVSSIDDVAQQTRTSEPIAPQFKKIVSSIDDVAQHLPAKRWWLQKLVKLLLKRLPFAQHLSNPELLRRAQSLGDENAIATLLRAELDRIRLPNVAWIPLAVLVPVNIVVVLFLG